MVKELTNDVSSPHFVQSEHKITGEQLLLLPKMEVDHDLEDLMGHIGEFGKYQGQQFFLHVLTAATAGIHMLSLVTVGATPDHRCAIPDVDVNGTAQRWDSPLVTSAIPKNLDGGLDSCHLLDPYTNESIPCSSWIYDTTYHTSSRVIEWDLVCDQRWLRAVAQAVYMFGVLVGAVVLGCMADKHGRKTILYISAIFQLVTGVGVAFCPEYYSFLVIRFLYGMFGSAGSYITGFVLSMELVGASKRTVCGIMFQAAFGIGVALVAFWGWLVPDRFYLQIIYGLHSALLLGHWWLVDESPRWLWAQGRVKEAVQIVEKGAKINGLPLPDVPLYMAKGNKAKGAGEEVKSYGVSDLFRTPNMRCKAMNICLIWFSNSLVYYGLSLNTGALEGNPYLLLGINGIIEIPSYIVTTLLLDRTGRRSLISTLMLTGGTCCIIAAVLPKDTPIGVTSSTIIVMAGKFFISGSFAIAYNYTAELFPTVIRNTALGTGSMFARLSGALTPLITLLDSLDKTLPIIIFGSIAIFSGVLSLLLPETLKKSLPQTLEDGEKFGKGDTCCSSCFGNGEDALENAVPLTSVD